MTKKSLEKEIKKLKGIKVTLKKEYKDKSKGDNDKNGKENSKENNKENINNKINPNNTNEAQDEQKITDFREKILEEDIGFAAPVIETQVEDEPIQNLEEFTSQIPNQTFQPNQTNTINPGENRLYFNNQSLYQTATNASQDSLAGDYDAARRAYSTSTQSTSSINLFGARDIEDDSRMFRPPVFGNQDSRDSQANTNAQSEFRASLERQSQGSNPTHRRKHSLFKQ